MSVSWFIVRPFPAQGRLILRWASTMRTLILTLLLVAASVANATEQMLDDVVLEGETYPLSTFPFEVLLLRPDFAAKLKEHTQKPFPCTALYRGYRATWEIKDSRLFLKELNFSCHGSRQVSLKEFFPSRDGLIEAIWYSGPLFIPLGKPQMERGRSIYDKHLKLTLKSGYIVQREYEPPEHKQ